MKSINLKRAARFNNRCNPSNSNRKLSVRLVTHHHNTRHNHQKLIKSNIKSLSSSSAKPRDPQSCRLQFKDHNNNPNLKNIKSTLTNNKLTFIWIVYSL